MNNRVTLRYAILITGAIGIVVLPDAVAQELTARGSVSGSYLAGRFARDRHDTQAAAIYFDGYLQLASEAVEITLLRSKARLAFGNAGDRNPALLSRDNVFLPSIIMARNLDLNVAQNVVGESS